jgi:hypothetical protein
MRDALHDLRIAKPVVSVPAQVDDSDVILKDCIEELLELRNLREQVRGFIQSVNMQLSRK